MSNRYCCLLKQTAVSVGHTGLLTACEQDQENQLDSLISQIYFWNKTLHVSYSSSVHRQEFFTVHTAMVYVIQVCCSQAVSKLYDIYHCCVYSEKLLTMDRGTVRNM